METAKVRGWSRRKSSLKVAKKVIKNSTIGRKANESRVCNFVPIHLRAPRGFMLVRLSKTGSFVRFLWFRFRGAGWESFLLSLPIRIVRRCTMRLRIGGSSPASRAIIFQLKCILSRVDGAICEVLNSCKLRRASCWREPNAQLWSAAMCLQWIMQSHKNWHRVTKDAMARSAPLTAIINPSTATKSKKRLNFYGSCHLFKARGVSINVTASSLRVTRFKANFEKWQCNAEYAKVV